MFLKKHKQVQTCAPFYAKLTAACTDESKKLVGSLSFLFFVFFFYLRAAGLGSGFPEHGAAGGAGSGCQDAAEGLM